MEWNASCYANEQFNQKRNLFATTKESRDPRETKRGEKQKKKLNRSKLTINHIPHKSNEFICFVHFAYHCDRYQRKILYKRI